jgi:hypothetical protein
MPEIGTKLICIDDKFSNPTIRNHFDPPPKEGEIYTLRGVRHEPNGKIGYFLREIKGKWIQPPSWGFEMVESSLSSYRFAELEEMENSCEAKAVEQFEIVNN